MKIVNYKLKISSLINPFLIIVIAAALRLIPHPPNIAPIAAIALFGGVYLNKKYALILPLLALFVSDLFLGFYGAPMMSFVYGSFFLTGCIGIFLKNHKKPAAIISAALFSSLLFYLLTNFGVWLTTPLYPKTLSGLLERSPLPPPFFRNTLIGDLLYTGVFFASYEIVLKLLNPNSVLSFPRKRATPCDPSKKVVPLWENGKHPCGESSRHK